MGDSKQPKAKKEGKSGKRSVTTACLERRSTTPVSSSNCKKKTLELLLQPLLRPISIDGGLINGGFRPIGLLDTGKYALAGDTDCNFVLDDTKGWLARNLGPQPVVPTRLSIKGKSLLEDMNKFFEH